MWFVIRVVVSLGILTYLISWIGIADLYQAFRAMNKFFLIPILFLLLGVLPLLRAASYKALLHKATKRISFWEVYGVNAYSWAVGSLLPGGKLGEVSAVYFFKKKNLPVEEGAAITIIDKLISVIVVSVLAVLGIARFIGLKESIMLIAIGIFALFVGVAIIFLFIRNRTLFDFLKKRLGRFGVHLSSLTYLLRTSFKEGKRYLLMNLVLTIAATAVAAGMYVLSFAAFGQSVSFFDVLLINSAGMLVALIPISIGGIGVRETSVVLLFSKLGINNAITLSAYLLIALIGYVIATMILLFYMSRTRKS